MTELEQTLQEENKSLQEENENLCQQVGQLQTQLSTMTAREKTIKPLIEEIKRQEREITSLNSSRTAERRKNESAGMIARNKRSFMKSAYRRIPTCFAPAGFDSSVCAAAYHSHEELCIDD